MQATDFAQLISFDDQSRSFVYGFEAGMIWQRMLAKEDRIDSEVPFSLANGPLYLRMAEHMGYEAEVFDCCDEEGEWNEIVFHRLPPAPPNLENVK